MEISRTFWLLDITNWWWQQDAMHLKYADLSNVVCDIISIIPYGVGVEARFSLVQDVIGWKQSNTTGETPRKKVVVRQFAQANNRLLSPDDPVLDSTSAKYDLEMNREAQLMKLHQMAKVHDIGEMWQGSEYLQATQKESCTQTKQLTALGYISDTEEIVKPSWSLFQHDGAAAFKLSENSPVPLAVSAKELAG
jgi:hypothetical protein